jgi:hypothetical protein
MVRWHVPPLRRLLSFMPLPGLHPNSRTVSLESAEQLRELGELSETHEGNYIFGEAEGSRSPGHRKEDPDLNELLDLNASIYDLTVQYSCLAVHRCGGSIGFPTLVTVLVLLVLNVFVQMTILFNVDTLIATPAKAHAQHLYQLFTEHCYGVGVVEYIYSQDVFDSFDSWEDKVAKNELCRYPLTEPTFFLLILLIWTLYLMHELKQTLYFWMHTVSLETPAEGRVTFLSHEGNYIITHMGRVLKLWISVMVFLPKFGIAVVLWYIGAGWLTATAGIDNLVLNSLALTFICEVDELIFRTCISEISKSCLDKTKLPLPSFRYTPTVWVPLETLVTCIACISLSYIYLYGMQDAIHDFRWDLNEVCRSNAVRAYHVKSHLGV